MGKLGATVVKELRLLFRDRAGLLVLFLMPGVLVVVVSLVQENVLRATGEAGIRVLVVDRDGGSVGAGVSERLRESGSFAVETLPGDTGDAEARKRLIDGGYQFCLILPQGLTRSVEERAARQVAAAMDGATVATEGDVPDDPAELILYFDPLVRGDFRTAVENGLGRFLMALELEVKAGILSEMVSERVGRVLGEVLGPEAAGGFRLDPGWSRDRLLAVRTVGAGRGRFEKLPSSVQQNVPAWALFGMFFIVVPLGGSLIRERQEGTLRRLMSLPVSHGVLLLGKVIAYVFVCLSQFAIILLIGKRLLPLLGTPELAIGSAPDAVLAVVVSAALAAAGYGVLVGSLARTYEQASMFGAVSVVIAAAIGGIMVPVYAMPPGMREVSRFSPLAWGLTALTDLFVRGEDLRGVAREIYLLLGFFGATMGIGWAGLVGRGRAGG